MNFVESQVHQREVSESSYEYLLGEMLSLTPPNDQSGLSNQRLDQLGYEVGYRC